MILHKLKINNTRKKYDVYENIKINAYLYSIRIKKESRRPIYIGLTTNMVDRWGRQTGVA